MKFFFSFLHFLRFLKFNAYKLVQIKLSSLFVQQNRIGGEKKDRKKSDLVVFSSNQFIKFTLQHRINKIYDNLISLLVRLIHFHSIPVSYLIECLYLSLGLLLRHHSKQPQISNIDKADNQIDKNSELNIIYKSKFSDVW